MTEQDTGPEQITDNLGRLVWTAEDQDEPLPGSVVLTGGDWGTAWQRNFDDGLWHSTRRKGGPKTWAWLLTRRNLRLAYDAERRVGVPGAFGTHLTGEVLDAALETAQ